MNLIARLFGIKKAIVPIAISTSSTSVDNPTQNTVDWRNSEIHLMLLQQFLKPNYINDIAPEQWAVALGEAPQFTLNRFIKDGLLTPLSLKAAVEHFNTVADLKKMLKERNLKVSGKKQELVERLVSADGVGISKIYEVKEAIECSPESRSRVLQYIADKERELNNVIADTFAVLLAEDHLKASRLIRSYESNQIRLPTRGLRIATMHIDAGTVDDAPAIVYDKPTPVRDPNEDVPILKEIFNARPKILKELAEDEWKPLQAVVALSYLLHGRLSLDWLPAEFIGVEKFGVYTTVHMMQRHIYYLRDLRQWRKMDIKQASIRGSSFCDECKKIADKVDDLDKLPELPYERCSGEDGCFCRISPVIFED